MYVQLDLLCFNVFYLHELNVWLIWLLLLTWIFLLATTMAYLVISPRVANAQSKCNNGQLRPEAVKQSNI